MTATRGHILIVDDERELRAALCETLADEGYETTGAGDVPDAVRALAGREFDLILSDLMMPGGSGLDLLRHVRDADPQQLLVIMTGQGSIHTAVEAMRLGAFDYVLKPFDLAFMLPVLDRALETRRLRAENGRLRAAVARLTYEGPRFQMIGTAPAMRPVLRLIEKVAATDSTVLVRGETGTGKELVARAVHHNSRRADKPLVTINCAALQESLLESELFGHEKGAFTGATQAKPGLIEVAEGGTLFIDEVAEMAPALQAKLLRVLEDGHYRRVGSTKDVHADVRVVAATNKPLEEEQKAGRFREDLYYRLNVVTVPLPPLRDRREDIPLLVEHLLATRSVGPQRCQVHPTAAAALLRYRWPGNVRELANVLERAHILAEDHLITLDDLPAELLPSPAQTPAGRADSTPPDGEVFDLGELERRAVRRAMAHSGGNKAQAAAMLGVTRRTLYRLLERYADPPANG